MTEVDLYTIIRLLNAQGDEFYTDMAECLQEMVEDMKEDFYAAHASGPGGITLRHLVRIGLEETLKHHQVVEEMLEAARQAKKNPDGEITPS